MPKKTIADYTESDPKDLPFKERAAKYEKAIKPICEKWGVLPWAGLQSTNELIASVPQLKDAWEKPAENGVSAA